jgi:hypothetical protein
MIQTSFFTAFLYCGHLATIRLVAQAQQIPTTRHFVVESGTAMAELRLRPVFRYFMSTTEMAPLIRRVSRLALSMVRR